MRAGLRSIIWLSVAACTKSDVPPPQTHAQPAPAHDPWESTPQQQTSPPGGDPWAQSPPPAPPATPPPPHAESGVFTAGRYACWMSGMGNYTASVLGTFTFGADGSYQTTAGSSGTYRIDGVRLALAGGKLDGWVGAVETPGATRRVRFRAETPADPGASIKVGDHVCTLRR